MTYAQAIAILDKLDSPQYLRDEANETVEAYETDGYANHTAAGFNY